MGKRGGDANVTTSWLGGPRQVSQRTRSADTEAEGAHKVGGVFPRDDALGRRFYLYERGVGALGSQ